MTTIQFFTFVVPSKSSFTSHDTTHELLQTRMSLILIITGRNSSCWKVIMFSQASVSHSVHTGGMVSLVSCSLWGVGGGVGYHWSHVPSGR